MTTIYLARHGQTEENVAGILQGHLPGCLTEEGKAQALLLGRRLEHISLDAVVSSDLTRCVDTVLLAVGQRQLAWERTPMLREIDCGSLTGESIVQVDFKHLPADVETMRMLYDRAGQVLDHLKQNYGGQRILVVSHGMLNRSMQAHIQGVTFEHLRCVPKMDNAELRKFLL